MHCSTPCFLVSASLAAMTTLCACDNQQPVPFTPEQAAGAASAMPYTAEDAFFASLPKGADARAVLCNPPLGKDDVVAHLCQPEPPVLHGIKDLQALLGFGFTDQTNAGSNGGADGNPAYALTGHSSSLVVSNVSAINPRTILCKDFGAIPNAAENMLPNPNYFACLGFTRGENLVEVITTDAGTGILNMYIIKYETQCSLTHTCTPGDLLTPAAEQNWVAYNAYQDTPFLMNTILDCRQCHEPTATNPAILRLQEVNTPYTHFLSSQSAGGRALLSDFTAAHGQNEDYGPIPAALIPGSDGGKIAQFLSREGFLAMQPNPFNSALIEAQVDASSPEQPGNNSVAGKSSTWDTIFAIYQTGNAIAPPYHDVKVSDANKLATFTADYQAVMSGQMALSELPDIRQIFPDDQTRLAQLGLAVVPGESVQQLFVNGCQQCHNNTLDQNLSRARFNVPALLAGRMSAEEKQRAANRLQQGPYNLELMPPRRFRVLQSTEITAMVNYLEQP